MSQSDKNGVKAKDDKERLAQIKQDFLAMLVDVEHTLGESKTLLGQLMVALEEMLGVVYQQNQNLKDRYKVELNLALMQTLPGLELGKSAMTEVDKAITKLNALNEKQKNLLKGMDTAKITQLFAGEAKGIPANEKTEIQKYFSGIISVLGENISANQTMLQQVEQEKERILMEFLQGKNQGASSENIVKSVDKLAKLLDHKYKVIDLQKKEAQQLRQQMEKGEPVQQPKPTTPKLKM